ncbi:MULTISPECIES: ClpXP protease specificity-enhancing factor [Oleiagrimonas]|jgi:stringent starvation protein B|uniref:ClpXP protease specificity-enhancing factor n=1 Tax=Oleiagrimonas citrea TaxID=1665687 RepID=A0A846ZJA4_9GAMM|nr:MULTISPECIES: ClpXP protease specificity-enhancing factor [Oleiagrimonas]NKZ38086.1 ClpXP protease specificity-enhancing factor [Oleiagrimonas citrea]RAP56306.1 ClpXP protease specificity-enhancing factor [Oleiagrimonas sp. MCCC 1A03011]
MSSNRPYLLRAIYDWVTDNGLTPYVLVDATRAGVQVPPHVVKDGQVVLNIAMRAVANLDLGNERIGFSARFSGVSQAVSFPVSAVLAIYAQENGQGMMFPEDADPPPPDDGVVESAPDADSEQASGDDGEGKPRRGAPHLRVIK